MYTFFLADRVYVFRCRLSLVRLCDSDFGITPVDDITIGISCVCRAVQLVFELSGVQISGHELNFLIYHFRSLSSFHLGEGLNGRVEPLTLRKTLTYLLTYLYTY